MGGERQETTNWDDAICTDQVQATDGQCQIRLRLDDTIHEWGIGCNAVTDTDESIAAHLARWIPAAEFLGCCITRVCDSVVISDSRKVQP